MTDIKLPSKHQIGDVVKLRFKHESTELTDCVVESVEFSSDNVVLYGIAVPVSFFNQKTIIKNVAETYVLNQ